MGEVILGGFSGRGAMAGLVADLVVVNGNLVTLDRRRPRARGMAIGGGRIVGVGEVDEIKKMVGEGTEVVDVGGKTVVPGFCDAHVHFWWYGRQMLFQADLVGVRDVAEMGERLLAVAGRNSGWVIGHGFDQEKMREGRFPTRRELDEICGERPVVVSRVCGHAVVGNSAAIKMLSREEAGRGDEERGLYTEEAVEGFYRRVPGLSEDEAEEAVLAAQRVALRTGITSVQTLLDTPEQMGAYARLRRKGKLGVRVMGIPPWSSGEALYQHGVGTTFGDEWVRFGGLKLFSDGSLGARTAWMREPYADDGATRGVRIYEPEELKRRCRAAQERGFQIAIHAIGDEALRETLDAIEYALGGESNEGHRHRVEHASVCPPDCLERMARLGIVVTIQPQFVTSDTWTGERLGKERRGWAYPFKAMVEAGVKVALSSDCPVEKMDGFAAMGAAVGRAEWSAEGGLSGEEALYAYCMGSAYAGLAEGWSGSLEVGKVGDFVVLRGDVTKANAKEIWGMRAEGVWVGGRRVSG